MVAIAVHLRPTARPSGLASIARDLPAGWERGVVVVIGSVTEPDRIGPCAVGDGAPQPKGDSTQFDPVVIRQGILCSMLGRPDTEADARAAAQATVWYALSLELYDGAATTNPSFADAVSLGSTDSVEEAVGALEAEAEANLFGRRAVIHVPLDLATLLGEDALVRVGDHWETVAGNLVAIHGVGDTVYATGEIWAEVGSIDARRYDNPVNNASEAWADIAGIVVFDPAFIASVSVTGTSP